MLHTEFLVHPHCLFCVLFNVFFYMSLLHSQWWLPAVIFLHCRYIFLEYMSPSHAVDAVKNADSYKLDKQHTFRVNLFTDFDKWVQLSWVSVDLGIPTRSACMEGNQWNCSFRYMTISDEWEIPEKQPFKDLVRIFWGKWKEYSAQYETMTSSLERSYENRNDASVVL